MKESDLQAITSQQSFINYCFKTSSEDMAYWENWLKQNPQYQQEVEELKNAILLLPVPASEKVIQHDFEKLQASISAGEAKANPNSDSNSTTNPQIKRLKLWPLITGIAAAIALIVVGSYLYKSKLQPTDNQQNVFVNDVAPGKNGATLTLANGRKIQLSTASNGELAKEAGVSITKTKSGELIYEIKDNNKSSQSINTLSTAKGETYQVVLPDGSKVWLNAASKLSYPARFSASGKRKVSLDGEAYFEIAKDKAHPFIVETAKQDVEVLGTHFNVNSYADENITKTTLLEGSVKVSLNSGNTAQNNQSNANETILKPGQEASLSNTGKISVAEADTELAMAWKNGKFIFDNERIEDIMRMLARWYNVEVTYQKGAGDQPFTGSISRSDNISKILEKITYTQNIHFKIEGRRVTVMP